MIDLFIVHAGADAEYVLKTVVPELIVPKDNKGCHTNVLLCGSEEKKEDYREIKEKLEENNANADNFEVAYTTEHDWKKYAKKYIKKSRVVLVVVSNHSSENGKEKTLGYEVNYAEKLGKLILFHKVSSDVKLPEYLMEKDRFTGKMKGRASEYTLQEIRERIDNFDIGYYDIFGNDKYKDPDNVKNDMEKIMEQYMMYQKTSEDLIARRQSVSSFYISVNGALVSLLSVIIGLISYPNNIVVVCAMAIVGVILNASWIKILESYGMLNSAKMKLISLMEKELPISLYDTEWQIMSDKMNKNRYVSFTDSEKRIPKIFTGLYVLVLLGTIVLFILKSLGKI